mmetsp:Transcript_31763/g.31042  ORF Transcript_31763/g.31042 Transcript_31763/m.31042 type:complete len:175 (-) Transcript_31763:2384-2908(-)
MVLDGSTTTIILQYIQSGDYPEQSRTLAAINLKNIIKKIYGQHTYTHYDERNAGSEEGELIDSEGLQILHTHLVGLMMGSPGALAKQYLEMISLMGKKYVQKEWQSLIPELLVHLQSQNANNIKLALEAYKKICKKYRFMFRSDDLYSEMNYMIENVSQHLLTQAMNCVEFLKG